MSVDITNSILTEKALDYAKLSRLAYAEWIKLDNTWILDPYYPGNDEYRELWKKISDKGYSVVGYCPNDPYTGYSGTIFYNTNTGQYILANRGTTPGDGKDINADAELAVGQTPGEQISSMINFINNSILASNQFDVTGHSLGGCLAQIAKQIYPNSVDEVYTYNSPGALNLTKSYEYAGLSENGGVWVRHPFIVMEGDQYEIDHYETTEWTQEAWNAYSAYDSSLDYTKVYNITPKGDADILGRWGTDIGKEVFIDVPSGIIHSIDNTISSLETGVYYIESKNPVTIIGSSNNEVLNGKEYYSSQYATVITLVGGNGNDTIYGGDGGNEIYGDLPDWFTAANKNESGNVDGVVAGNDSIEGGSGKDTIYGGDGADILIGDNGDLQADSLSGGDYIDGGAGAVDRNLGLDGNDPVYFVDNTGENNVIYFRNIIPFRQKIKHKKYKNTWRRFSQPNLRRIAA